MKSSMTTASQTRLVISQAKFSRRKIGTGTVTVVEVTERKKSIVEAIDKVALHLGNTRTVCKKYYIHPDIFTLYESKQLDKYLLAPANNDEKEDECFLAVEKTMMKILEGKK